MNICSFNFCKFENIMYKTCMQKSFYIRILVLLAFCSTVLLTSGCNAQKRYKAVPCPCEKKNR